MHASFILRKFLIQGDVIGHLKRREALLKVTEALAMGASLTLTCLGRGLSGNATEKHRIKCVDELLSNRHLHTEREAIYREVAHRVLCSVTRVVVQVDWSDTGRRDVRVLRATIALPGRSFVLWEQVYEEREYNKDSTHTEFMHAVHRIIPAWCKQVVVVTDAGYRAPWFRLIEKLGWYWIGRIRNNGTCRGAATDDGWVKTRQLYARAGNKPQDLGLVQLNKSAPLHAHLYLSSKPQPKRRGARRNAEHYRAAKSHREPWLLATSASLPCTVKQVLALYDTRMQIEQSFRDLKSHRFAHGIRYSQSTKPVRVAILLLISALVTFTQWLAGLVAEANDWTRTFQANTERKRRTLSIIFVGARVLRTSRFELTDALIQQALKDLSALFIQHHHAA